MASYCAITILFVGILGCTNGTKENPNSSAELVREIEKIRLTDFKGKSINLHEHQGKTIFLNVWATWCKPCIQEMPSIEDAQRILLNENIIFLLASGENVAQIEEFSNTHEYKFNYIRIENSEEMNVQALPTTFIFNQHGDLVFSESGTRKWNEKKNIDLIRKISKGND